MSSGTRPVDLELTVRPQAFSISLKRDFSAAISIVVENVAARL